WVSGDHVGGGYWGQNELSAATFGGHLQSGKGPYLRTGDLGFVHEGHLYIAGRLKDLIIVRGRNLYPQDIERTVESSYPSLRQGCSVAFAIDVDSEERLVVVAEVGPDGVLPFDADKVIGAIRAAISEREALNVHAVVLIAPRSLPKTSSGKVQRRATRAAFLA